MKIIRVAMFSLICITGLELGNVMASEPITVSETGVKWNVGLSGVSLFFDASGGIDKIVSVWRQPVMVADTRGINKARIIATEKAKAAIVRFIDEDVSTTKVISEMQTDIDNTKQLGTGEAATISSSVTRHMVESVTEITKSSASGLLRGVVVLEAGYDGDTQEVYVTVGISQNTMKASSSMKLFLEQPSANGQSTKSNPSKANTKTTNQTSSGSW